MSDMAWYWSQPDLAGWHKRWHHIHTATNVRNPPQFKTITKVIIVLNPGFLIREHHNLRITVENEEFRSHWKWQKGTSGGKWRWRSTMEVRHANPREIGRWKKSEEKRGELPRTSPCENNAPDERDIHLGRPCNSLLNYIETTTATSAFQLLVQ